MSDELLKAGDDLRTAVFNLRAALCDPATGVVERKHQECYAEAGDAMFAWYRLRHTEPELKVGDWVLTASGVPCVVTSTDTDGAVWLEGEGIDSIFGKPHLGARIDPPRFEEGDVVRAGISDSWWSIRGRIWHGSRSQWEYLSPMGWVSESRMELRPTAPWTPPKVGEVVEVLVGSDVWRPQLVTSTERDGTRVAFGCALGQSIEGTHWRRVTP